ncbi:RagB/SusD family nutrient uptake outer membrane protein [Seonamhaeicola aphaedonensis]|uniref:Putative outer membrane starch-binding protein n=1 Tax=Seonamhaeicola aphaedonensis TaxID=1461338 RepID=A0A3D9HLI0_9FLAO|nr:RagB/SusD family nutrient uptake outer membrane protein [Seonamhaeicola aphaedonensis]RED50328.1 putative outer membrane starch-binding protein [Seonamhaeicola aphaedonensis]
MYKRILIILTILISFGCEDQLDKQADFISENVVFEDEALTEAYLAGLYNNMSFQIFGGFGNINIGMIAAAGAEHINFANWQTPNSTYRRQYTAETGPGPLDRWPYFNIRNINILIRDMPNSVTLNESFKKEKIAEARFLRAYEYFELARRFGGVPLITVPQNTDDPEEELFPARSNEKDIYDFIYNELELAIPDLSETPTGAEGRIDKSTALMLQSRAMLYAASIANFGEVKLNGIVGIPDGEAIAYYQKSYDASKAVIESNLFSLYNKSADKVQNFSSLFLDEGLGNPEIIFAERFEPFIKGHSLDWLANPDGLGLEWNSNFPVLYDFAELFDFTDGRTGKSINRGDLNANNTWDINDFFGNRDPRFIASIFYPETEWKGQKIYFHGSTQLENGTVSTNRNLLITKPGTGEQLPAAAAARNVRNTALLARKRLDPSNTATAELNSGQDFFVFRYAETLLNLAEAAYYLGRTDEALEAINMVRERAGMPLRNSITEDNIRQERQVELAFEEQRYWDLIRWRIATDVLGNVRTKGLVFRYNLATDTYRITLKNAEGNIRQFGEERYYLPFGQNRLADNPNLIQNPGY